MKTGTLFTDSCRAVRTVNWFLLGIPILIVLLAADRLLPNYETVISEYEENSLRLQRAQVQADALPKYLERIAADKETYDLFRVKAYSAGDVNQSIAQFSADLNRMLAAVYIQPTGLVQVQTARTSATGTLMEVRLTFNCVPQQLQSLELQLLALPRLTMVTSLVASVEPDTMRGSQQLVIELTVHALHVNLEEPMPNAKKEKPNL